MGLRMCNYMCAVSHACKCVCDYMPSVYTDTSEEGKNSGGVLHTQRPRSRLIAALRSRSEYRPFEKIETELPLTLGSIPGTHFLGEGGI